MVFAPNECFPCLAENHPFILGVVFLQSKITPGSLLPYNGCIFTAQMARLGAGTWPALSHHLVLGALPLQIPASPSSSPWG